MSRIGSEPITIPAGVTVTVDEHNHVAVKGPKGEISRDCHKDMKITVGEGVVTVDVHPKIKCIDLYMVLLVLLSTIWL